MNPLAEVKVLPPESTGRTRLIAELESLVERAKAGELLGITFVGETSYGLIWGRRNMNYDTAMGGLARAIYHLNKDWDSFGMESPNPPTA